MARDTKRDKGGSDKWGNVPEEGANLPELSFDFTVDEAEVDETDDGYKRYVVELSVTAPDEFEGQKHWERFVVGSEEDPEGEDVKTLRKSFGARRFKAMCQAAGVTMSDDDDDLLADLKGAKVAGIIGHREYEGSIYAGIKRGGWYPIGELTPGEGTADDEKKTSRKRKSKDVEEEEAPKKRGPGRPKKVKDEEEEVDEEEEQPRRRRADDDERPRAGKKKHDEEEEEEEEEESELPSARRRRR